MNACATQKLDNVGHYPLGFVSMKGRVQKLSCMQQHDASTSQVCLLLSIISRSPPQPYQLFYWSSCPDPRWVRIWKGAMVAVHVKDGGNSLFQVHHFPISLPICPCSSISTLPQENKHLNTYIWVIFSWNNAFLNFFFWMKNNARTFREWKG